MGILSFSLYEGLPSMGKLSLLGKRTTVIFFQLSPAYLVHYESQVFILPPLVCSSAYHFFFFLPCSLKPFLFNIIDLLL